MFSEQVRLAATINMRLFLQPILVHFVETHRLNVGALFLCLCVAGPKLPHGDGDPFYASARVLLDPSASVGNGQQYTFTFTITAPNTPGTYTIRPRMLQESVT
jgi:hypothetical protein